MVTFPYDKYFRAERLNYKHSIKPKLWCLFLHCLFVFVCSNFFLDGGATREYFTCMKMLPLPVNGCKFSPLLGTQCHWPLKGFFWHATSTVTRDIHIHGYIRGSVTFTAAELHVTTFRTTLSYMREERSTVWTIAAVCFHFRTKWICKSLLS